MRYLSLIALLLTMVSFGTKTLAAQETEVSKPGPSKTGAVWDVLRTDVGTWDVEIKTWSGPGEPTVTKGKETSRMLGDHWLLSDFQGNMMGLDFSGHGCYSYDVEKKQYYGTWIDSLSPNRMEMIGKHDPENRTMTYEGMAPGPDGQIAKHIIETQYSIDGTRVMTMNIQAGEQVMKIFEMAYTKANEVSASNESE